MNMQNELDDDGSNQLSTSQFMQLNTPLSYENQENLFQLNDCPLNEQSDQLLSQGQDMLEDNQDKSQAIATAAITTTHKEAQIQVDTNLVEQQATKKIRKPKNKDAQNGKNAAKQLGNYLRKHIINRKLTHIPQLQNFVSKKQTNIQSNYTLKDWRDMLMEENEYQSQCQDIAYNYLKNWAYIDILQEYKQIDPQDMIKDIGHFICGCKNPSMLICNKR